MRRIIWVLLALAVWTPTVADAGEGWKEFCRKFQLYKKRTQAWPEPFIHRDREAVRSPWDVMEHNGWRSQNTLTEHLFTDDGELTEAGRRKIVWIATQAPEERRTVYILATEDRNATLSRTESVKQLVADLSQQGIAPPQMMMTSRRPLSWQGDYFDRVEKASRDNVAPPVLPEMVLTTEGG
ncbi:MAG: hypothetical protein KDB14_12955 [Planctomycetales bacterium]|nr:hypothetical protein [Planctomycetales bacterium]